MLLSSRNCYISITVYIADTNVAFKLRLSMVEMAKIITILENIMMYITFCFSEAKQVGTKKKHKQNSSATFEKAMKNYIDIF